MKARLSTEVYDKLKKTIENRENLVLSIVGEVAIAMKG